MSAPTITHVLPATEQPLPEGGTPYSIRGYKGHAGREGTAWVGNLYRDNTRVASLVQEGNGGATRAYFEAHSEGADRCWKRVLTDMDRAALRAADSAEEAAFVAHAATWGNVDLGGDVDFPPIPHTAETVLDALAAEVETAAALGRWSKNGVVLCGPGERPADGTFRCLRWRGPVPTTRALMAAWEPAGSRYWDPGVNRWVVI